MRARLGFALALVASLSACAATGDRPGDAASIANPYPSTYRAYPGVPTALVGATVYDGAGGRIDNGTVLFAQGKVFAIGGPDLAIPAGYTRIDGRGKFVTPGVIDIIPTPAAARRAGRR